MQWIACEHELRPIPRNRDAEKIVLTAMLPGKVALVVLMALSLFLMVRGLIAVGRSIAVITGAVVLVLVAYSALFWFVFEHAPWQTWRSPGHNLFGVIGDRSWEDSEQAYPPNGTASR